MASVDTYLVVSQNNFSPFDTLTIRIPGRQKLLRVYNSYSVIENVVFAFIEHSSPYGSMLFHNRVNVSIRDYS